MTDSNEAHQKLVAYIHNMSEEYVELAWNISIAERKAEAVRYLYVYYIYGGYNEDKYLDILYNSVAHSSDMDIENLLVYVMILAHTEYTDALMVIRDLIKNKLK